MQIEIAKKSALDSHTAQIKGAHGVPNNLSSGQGLVWDAAQGTWVATTIASTQALADETTARQAHEALTTTAHGGVVASADSRLTDQRIPTDSSVTNAKVSATAAIAESKLSLASDGPVGTPTRRSIGTGSTQAMAGNTRLDTIAAPTGPVALNSQRITGVADGTNTTDAATWGQVSALIQGLSPKDSVRAATTANITLSGTQTIDGIVLNVNDRVLVKNQTTASQNGLYAVASGAWTRVTDADTAGELQGASVFVDEGSTLANTLWVQTNDNITLGTSNVTWTQFNALGDLLAGTGITKSGNTISANLTTLQARSERGAVNGYPTLDGTGKVPTTQLPPLGSTASIIQGGILPSSYNLDMASKPDVWLRGTLAVDTTIVVQNNVAPSRLALFLIQDATGGHTLSVADGSGTISVNVPTASNTGFWVSLSWDGTDLWVDVAGGGGGLPPGTSPGQGLVWNGTIWQLQDIATQTELDATQAQVTSIASSSGGSFVDSPKLHGFLGWSGLPESNNTGGVVVSGVPNFNRVFVPGGGITLSSITFVVTTALTGTLTAGQCFVGVYDSAGTLIGTGDISGTFGATQTLTTTGVKTAPITVVAGQSLAIPATAPIYPAGLSPREQHVYCAILLNGTLTSLQMQRVTTNTNTLNSGCNGTTIPYRTGQIGASKTSLPTPLIGNTTGTANGDTAFWFCVA